MASRRVARRAASVWLSEGMCQAWCRANVQPAPALRGWTVRDHDRILVAPCHANVVGSNGLPCCSREKNRKEKIFFGSFISHLLHYMSGRFGASRPVRPRRLAGRVCFSVDSPDPDCLDPLPSPLPFPHLFLFPFISNSSLIPVKCLKNCPGSVEMFRLLSLSLVALYVGAFWRVPPRAPSAASRARVLLCR